MSELSLSLRWMSRLIVIGFNMTYILECLVIDETRNPKENNLLLVFHHFYLFHDWIDGNEKLVMEWKVIKMAL